MAVADIVTMIREKPVAALLAVSGDDP